jgi:hypothetical protein
MALASTTSGTSIRRRLVQLLAPVAVLVAATFLTPAATPAFADDSAPMVASFTTNTVDVAPGSRVTLTARVSKPIDDSTYFLRITDTFADKPLVQCFRGTVCSTTISFPTATTHTFAAHLDRGRGGRAPYPLVSSSTEQQIFWHKAGTARPELPAIRYLRPPPADLLVGTGIVLTVFLTEPIDDSTYFVRITDLTTDTIVAQCDHGTECSGTVSSATAATHTYEAHLDRGRRGPAPYSIMDRSKQMTITWGSDALTLEANTMRGFTTTHAALGERLWLGAHWNSYIDNSTYFVRVSDATTGVILKQCFSGWSCGDAVSSATPATHTYIAEILSGRNTPGPFPIISKVTLPVQWGESQPPKSSDVPNMPQPPQAPPQTTDLAFTSTAGFNPQNGSIQMAVGNIGTAAAGPFSVRVILDGRQEAYYPSSGLAAGQSLILTESLAQVAAGAHSLFIVIDPLNQVPESNEDNNSKNVYFTITTDGLVAIQTP